MARRHNPPYGHHGTDTAVTQPSACLVPASRHPARPAASRPWQPPPAAPDISWCCRTELSIRQEVRGMKRLLGLVVGVLAVLWLIAAQANADTLSDCLAKQHVCVAGDGRSLISQSQEAQLERQIGGDAIYLAVAASGSSGYDSAMARIIAALSGHPHFTVGFLDSRLRHFGAYNSGMLPPHGAAEIATRVVQQHQADQNIFAALTAFVTDVKQQAGSGPGAEANRPSHVLQTVLITLSIILVVAMLGFFAIWRPIRKRRQQELKDAKLAAQDDL